MSSFKIHNSVPHDDSITKYYPIKGNQFDIWNLTKVQELKFHQIAWGINKLRIV